MGILQILFGRKEKRDEGLVDLNDHRTNDGVTGSMRRKLRELANYCG